MFFQGHDDAVGQHRHPIFHPFPIANHNLMLGEIHVFDAQPQTFHQPQTAAIQ
jgi:hypothetical protein